MPRQQFGAYHGDRFEAYEPSPSTPGTKRSAGVAITPEYYHWLHNVPPEVAEADWIRSQDLLRGKYVTDRTSTFELYGNIEKSWQRALPHRASTFFNQSYHSFPRPFMLQDTNPSGYRRRHWRF